MNPIDFAIHKPVTVWVGVILLGLFGLIALFSLPIQLTPDVDTPVITVSTNWEGASPQEVEREIIDEQEDQLKSVVGLRKMTSQAFRNRGQIFLEFYIGTDISRALLEVNDKLRQVPSYPENVDEPVISAGESQEANAIAWFILERRGNSPLRNEELPYFRTLLEEQVKPILERAHGVAHVGIFGGVEQEVHVHIDPNKLVARELTLLDVRDAIRGHNIDISAGTVEAGKRSFTVRTIGKFTDVEQIENLILARREGGTVYLKDVGKVALGYKEPTNIVRSIGHESIALNATRESGTNVIVVMASLQEAMRKANAQVLTNYGLQIEQVYDQTRYIYSAIDLVLQNIYVGGVLAIIVLLLFLRNSRPTLIIGMAIPISVIGSFLVLTLLGRNLNVISLAGFAFAVGMVVDNSIVVLENIFRHRQLGKDLITAALVGTREVWGAVLASTLTTLAVFIPILFVEEEAGQLFRDIAIAISAAVFLSLIVSVFFIPMTAARILGTVKTKQLDTTEGMQGFGQSFTSAVAALVAWINHSVLLRIFVVALFTTASIGLSIIFAPQMAYLPNGNQNLVFSFVIPPPGYDINEFTRMGEKIEAKMRPYWKVREGKELTEEEKFPPWYQGEKPLPGMPNFFFVAFDQNVFMGAMSEDDSNVQPLIDLFYYAAGDLPGVYVFAQQASLFERGLDSSNSVSVEVRGADMGKIQQAAGALMGTMFARIGPTRPDPGNFNLGAPELRVKIDQERTAELGLNVRDLGFMMQSMVDGAIVGDFRFAGENIDVKILPDLSNVSLAEKLEQIPLFTPAGRQVPLSSLASIQETTAPDVIRHSEEMRAVQLTAEAKKMELGTAIDIVEQEIIPTLRDQGQIAADVSTVLAGSADKLVTTRQAMQWNFVLAIVITYLLLASLFESFLFPLVILFSVPLAAVGGILGLRLVQASVPEQHLDILTMLGFIILIGTVVNNAILIVHQALNHIRLENMEFSQAIVQSVKTRIRPIFMSTLTSVFGMLPLVLFPGAGSELYRGLGSVVVGGLIASTLFTIIVVPAMFSLALNLRMKIVKTI